MSDKAPAKTANKEEALATATEEEVPEPVALPDLADMPFVGVDQTLVRRPATHHRAPMVPTEVE